MGEAQVHRSFWLTHVQHAIGPVRDGEAQCLGARGAPSVVLNAAKQYDGVFELNKNTKLDDNELAWLRVRSRIKPTLGND